MKQKIVILGCSGMLGSMVLDVLSKDKTFSLIATARNQKEIDQLKTKYLGVAFKSLDVQKASVDDLKKVIGGSSWVINAIGIIKPYIHDDNPEEVERAILVNSLYPHNLARAAKEKKAKIIQIETDCVYSGKKGGYNEDDEHDPLDVYGKTKSLGETKFENVFHLRDSIIGPEPQAHISLMDWFLSQPKGATVSGYTNHKWNGVTTYHFAKICLGIIKNNLKIPHFQHVIAVDKPSKADMLKFFAKYFNRLDIKITPVKADKVIDRTLSTKNTNENLKIWKAAGYQKPPTVETMIKEISQYMEENR